MFKENGLCDTNSLKCVEPGFMAYYKINFYTCYIYMRKKFSSDFLVQGTYFSSVLNIFSA